MAQYTKRIEDHVLFWEGGFAVDQGGPTKHGVTWATYQDYSRPVLGRAPVYTEFRAMSPEDAKKFIAYFFNVIIRGKEIHDQAVAERFLDWRWNTGPWATKKVIRAINAAFKKKLPESFTVSPDLVKTMNSLPAQQVYEVITSAQKAHYDGLAESNPAKYGDDYNGWINRFNDLLSKHAGLIKSGGMVAAFFLSSWGSLII